MAKTAAIIVWLGTTIDFYYSWPAGAKYFFSFFPNVALKYVFHVTFQFERSGKNNFRLKTHLLVLNYKLSSLLGKPFGYSNLYSNLFDDGLNVGGVLACMISWTIIYLPIAWYIERIFPGDYGAPLPFYFPFMVCACVVSYKST
jgi:hypothetical protein